MTPEQCAISWEYWAANSGLQIEYAPAHVIMPENQ